MTIKVLPAEEADLARFSQFDQPAFKASSDSVFFNVLFPPATSTSMEAAAATRVADMARVMREDPSAHFIKAVDTELGAIVGFAKWHVWADGMPPSPKRRWGPGCNAEACDEYFGGIDALKDRLMVGKRCVFLQPVVTDPAHQRRGIGKKLIQWGLDEAERLGVPAFLIASADGHLWYEKCGFVDMDEVSADFTRYGVPKVAMSWAMIRQ